MRHRGTGLREQLDLAVVEPHAVRDDGALGEDAALVEHLERTATEPLERLLHLPDRLRRVSVDAGVELLGQRQCISEALLAAVEEVLESDPGAHAAVGGGAVGLEQTTVRLERLEVVELAVGDVGDEGGAQPDGLGRRRGALHVAPHVHHRRRAREHALGVAVQRRGGRDLRRHRLVRGVDVGLQPVPQRHRLRGAAQETGVQVRVVESGQHRVTGEVDDLGAGRTRIGVDLLDRADREDLVTVDEHRTGIERDAPPPVMGRTIPLRNSVGIRSPCSPFNKLSISSRHPSSRDGHM